MKTKKIIKQVPSDVEYVMNEKVSVAYFNGKNIGSSAHIPPSRTNSYMLHGILLVVCNEGWADVIINQERRHLEKGMVVVILSEQIFSLDETSSDISLDLMYVPQKMLSEINYHLLPVSAAEMLDNEYLTVNEQTRAEMRSLMAIIHHYSQQPETAQNFNLLISLIESLSMLVGVACNRIAKSSTRNSRQRTITKAFFERLSTDYSKQHDVAYYAAQQQVSPKYLSAAVRNVTGYPAQEWIGRVITYSAKQMLKSTDKSVAQIGEELSFGSASAFIRFFKRHTGTTPLAYRK